MAKQTIAQHGISIRLACAAFRISDTCYSYQPKPPHVNAFIADWFLRLKTANRNWGSGLCFLYLRNVKGFRQNHKRVTEFTGS